MNVPFRIHIIIQILLVMFQFLPSVCEENSHHIALYLITPPFPPQVQVRPVTPVTSICQVSCSRLCTWHDLFFRFLALIPFVSFVFLPSLVFPSNPSGVNAVSSQEAEFEMTAWKHVITQSRCQNIWPNILNVFSFLFWGWLLVSVSYFHANDPSRLSVWITLFSLNRESPSGASVLDDFSLASVSIFSLWAWPLLWVNKLA